MNVNEPFESFFAGKPDPVEVAAGRLAAVGGCIDEMQRVRFNCCNEDAEEHNICYSCANLDEAIEELRAALAWLP